MNDKKIAVVILAGGNVPKEMEKIASSRATIKIGERYILSYIVDAIKKSGFTREDIVALVPSDVMPALESLNIQLLPSSESIVKNMTCGANNFPSSEYENILFVTGDIPLITSEAIEDYIAKSLNANVSFTYPIIPRIDSEKLCPNGKRTYVKLVDGEFTGGNLFFANINFLHDKAELIEKIYSYRKAPLKLAGILGLSFIIKFVAKKLSISEIEKKVENIISANVKAIITSYPEIGFDVDKPSDLEEVNEYFKVKV